MTISLSSLSLCDPNTNAIAKPRDHAHTQQRTSSAPASPHMPYSKRRNCDVKAAYHMHNAGPRLRRENDDSHTPCSQPARPVPAVPRTPSVRAHLHAHVYRHRTAPKAHNGSKCRTRIRAWGLRTTSRNSKAQQPMNQVILHRILIFNPFEFAVPARHRCAATALCSFDFDFEL